MEENLSNTSIPNGQKPEIWQPSSQLIKFKLYETQAIGNVFRSY